MGTDQLIELLSEVCAKLLPVAGLILLIFLILFIKNLIVALKSLIITLSTTNKMIEDCNIQVNKLDKPLATMNELSESVDQVHTMTKNALTSTIAIILNNLENIRDWIMSRKDKDDDFDSMFEETSEQESEDPKNE